MTGAGSGWESWAQVGGGGSSTRRTRHPLSPGPTGSNGTTVNPRVGRGEEARDYRLREVVQDPDFLNAVAVGAKKDARPERFFC